MFCITKCYFDPYPDQILEKCDTLYQAETRLREIAENSELEHTGSLIGSRYVYTFKDFFLTIEQIGKENKELEEDEENNK